MKLERGFLRLGISLATLWFVFWTFAYVMRPHASDNTPAPHPVLPLTAQLVLIGGAILGVPWIAGGFRSK